MKVNAFDFDLPGDRIAQTPARPRDAARLLHVAPGPGGNSDRLGDFTIGQLPGLLRPGDRLVVNDTRVIPSRLFGRRGQAAIEVTLHKRAVPGCWWAFARPAKRLKAGQTIDFAAGLAAHVADKRDGGQVLLDFQLADAALLAALETHGAMPLPPYIRRAAQEPADRDDYQTAFAAEPGAVAAPTAALHFTPALLAALAANAIALTALTLHVGAGTFLPVKADDTDAHAMHAEWGRIGEPAAAEINATRADGGRIVAVGTTSLRLLETAAQADGGLAPFEGETDIFILPGHGFRMADMLMTNFHLPRSTLFMLVSAFAGTARMKRAYAHAIKAGYRFYSYGDSCLLEPGA